MDVYRPSRPEQQLPEQDPPEQGLPSRNLRLLHSIAMTVGVGLALLVSSFGGPVALWGKISRTSALQNKSSVSSAATFSDRDLDRQNPQKQAEILLERAVSRSDGARAQSGGSEDQIEAQIEARIDAWRGQLQWDSQLGDLTTVALNSSDQRLRASAVEVQLAAYGLPKSQSSVDALERQADSRNHARKIWALWSLGLLGNRGVETDRVVQVLSSHLNDSGKDSARDRDRNSNNNNNEDARRWAVEGLALVGTTATIAPLLDAMHNDPSAMVREHAACSLAQSAMLSHDQRLIAVPRLISYTSDPVLDAQTQALAFQALAAITKQHLPNDSTAWRNWYQTSLVSGQ